MNTSRPTSSASPLVRSDGAFAALFVAGVMACAAVVAALEWRLYRGVVWPDVAKAAIVAMALAGLAWERRRRRTGRPIARTVARRCGIALGAAAVAAWHAGALYAYPGFFHVWDQFHYVVGSKYFRELGYDGLYRCAAVALDQAGTVRGGDGSSVDLRAEVRASGFLVRDLDRGNVLVPAAGALADPSACTARFTPARWEAFRRDVVFFRMAAGAEHWARMQRDHGYNPPPPWTAIGGAIAKLRSASSGWMITLALLDPLLVLGAFAALAWVFGWRTASLAAVFWGCQAFAPFFWTGGAFLRQDWFFLGVFAVCLSRRGRHAAAGASLAAAAALRVFPALLAVGWMVMLLDPRTPHPRRRAMVRTAAGGFAAAAVMLAAGASAAGWDAYPAFARHIRLHERTPLTNEMGLRPLLTSGVGDGAASGRLRYLRDERLPDPVQRWKDVRVARWHSREPAAWAAALLLAVPFVIAIRRARRTWTAPGLSVLWIALLLQLTSYYYSVLVVIAPLARLRRRIEGWMLAAALASQIAAAALWWFDERHLALSVIAFALLLAVNGAFVGRRRVNR